MSPKREAFVIYTAKLSMSILTDTKDWFGFELIYFVYVVDDLSSWAVETLFFVN